MFKIVLRGLSVSLKVHGTPDYCSKAPQNPIFKDASEPYNNLLNSNPYLTCPHTIPKPCCAQSDSSPPYVNPFNLRRSSLPQHYSPGNPSQQPVCKTPPRSDPSFTPCPPPPICESCNPPSIHLPLHEICDPNNPPSLPLPPPSIFGPCAPSISTPQCCSFCYQYLRDRYCNNDSRCHSCCAGSPCGPVYTSNTTSEPGTIFCPPCFCPQSSLPPTSPSMVDKYRPDLTSRSSKPYPPLVVPSLPPTVYFYCKEYPCEFKLRLVLNSFVGMATSRCCYYVSIVSMRCIVAVAIY